LGQDYDAGSDPAVGLNSAGTVLEVHKNQLGSTLYYRLGQLQAATVAWETQSHTHDGGTQPDCALNAGNVAVEMHKNEAGHTLYTQVGTVSSANQTVQWHGAEDSGGGYTPGIALNDANVVVGVQRTSNVVHASRLYIRVGKVLGKTVEWKKEEQYDSGYFPRVALNNANVVVVVYQADGSETDASGLWIKVGRVGDDKVVFDLDADRFDQGVKPRVALTEDGRVIVAWMRGNKLFQCVGTISGSTVSWMAEGRNLMMG